MPKRSDYISWDEYFMGIAMLSACRSKDPNTQVGACIVNDRNRIMSVGYNGFPSGCDAVPTTSSRGSARAARLTQNTPMSATQSSMRY